MPHCPFAHQLVIMGQFSLGIGIFIIVVHFEVETPSMTITSPSTISCFLINTFWATYLIMLWYSSAAVQPLVLTTWRHTFFTKDIFNIATTMRYYQACDGLARYMMWPLWCWARSRDPRRYRISISMIFLIPIVSFLHHP